MKKRSLVDFFDQFLENSMEMLCTTDMAWKIKKLNREWEKILGYSLHELEGKTFFDYMHPEDRKKIKTQIQREDQEQKAYSFKTRFKHIDEHYLELEWKSFSSEGLNYISARKIKDLKKAGKSNNQQNDFYWSLVENSSTAIFTIDNSGLFVYVNNAFCLLTGYKREEILQQDIFKKLGIEGKIGLNILKTGKKKVKDKTQKIEIEINRKDGQSVLTEMVVSDLTDESGHSVKQGQLLEIFSYKKNENETKKLLSLHKLILDTIAIPVTYLKDKKIKWFNKAFDTILGYTQQELFGKEITYIFEEQQEFKRIGKEAGEKLRNGEIYKTITKIKKKSGEIIWACLTAKSLGPELPYESIWMMEDITETMQVRENLKKSNEYFNGITQNIPGIVFQSYVRKNGEIGFYYVSENSSKYIGIDNSNLDTFLEEFLKGVDKELYPEILSSIYETTNSLTRWEYEAKYTKPDGEEIYLHGISHPRKINDEVVSDGLILDITEKKKTEKKLEESQLLYQALIETQTDLISRYRPDTILTYVNDAYCKFFGKSREELIGNTYLFMIAPEFQEKVKNETKKLFEENGTQTGEYINFRYDGTPCWIHWAVQCITDENNKVIELQAIGRDLTKLKNAEEALLLNERKYRDVFNATSDAILIIEIPEGRLIDVNDSMLKIYGFKTKEEALAADITSFSLDLDPYNYENAVEKLRMADEIGPQKLEWKIRQLETNKILWLDVSLQKSEIGGRKSIIATIRDITERKETEEKFTQLAVLHHTILDTINIGLLYIQNRKIQWANNAFYSIFGYEYGERNGFDTSILYTSLEDYNKIEHEGYSLLSTGQVYTTEILVKKKDGTLFWVEMNGKAENPENSQKGSIWSIADITKKKNAEEEHIQLADLHQTILDTISGGLSYVQYHHTLWANTAFFKMFGYSPSEIIEAETSNLFATYDEFTTLKNDSLRIMKEGKVYTAEMMLLRKDRKKIWVSMNGKAIDSENPKMGAIWMFQDITERKKAEAELSETRVRLQSFMDSATDIMIIMDKDTNILEINKKGIELIENGKEKSAILGKRMSMVYSNFKASIITKKFKQVIDSGIPETFEEVIYIDDEKAEEREFWFLVKLFKVGDDLGLVSSNISFQKKAEIALQRSEESLQTAQQIAKIGNIELEIETGKGYFSNEMYKILGLDKEKGIPKLSEFIEAIHPEDRNLILDSMSPDKLFDHSWTVNFRSNMDKGPIRYFRSINKIISNLQTKTHIMFGTVQDITEQMKIEEEIRKLNSELEARVFERTSQLEQANKDLEAFAYSVSHDLRAPLRHIDGFLRLLYSNISSPSQIVTNYFDKIRIAAKRMSSMIEELLTFSRLGRKELAYTPINLSGIINDVIEQFKPDYANREVEWKIGKFPIIKGDIALIKTVFDNLISNAIKYSSKKPVSIIEIGSYETPDNMVTVYVKDNGAGFDMAYYDKLFKVFQRLHTSEEFEGIGIGLANVKRIVNKHGGSISAESKVDEGSTFMITLPV